MGKPTLGYSPLTGTTYVLLRKGKRRVVPEGEVVAVISSFLDDRHLKVTKPDGTEVRYGVLGENNGSSSKEQS